MKSGADTMLVIDRINHKQFSDPLCDSLFCLLQAPIIYRGIAASVSPKSTLVGNLELCNFDTTNAKLVCMTMCVFLLEHRNMVQSLCPHRFGISYSAYLFASIATAADPSPFICVKSIEGQNTSGVNMKLNKKGSLS